MEKETPNYYTLPDGRDLWEIFTPEERRIICRFNTIKYAFRAGNKDSEQEAKDLKKARRYINKRLADIEKAATTGNDVKAYGVDVEYTDGSTETLTLAAADSFDTECQATLWCDRRKTVKHVGEAVELTAANLHRRRVR